MKVGGAKKLDIVLRSATGLKKVHTTRRMAAYAVAWIEPSVRVPSPMDRRHGSSPVWNTTISITLDEHTLGRAGNNLHIELLAQGLVSTTPIGFVRVDMTELLLKGSQGAASITKFHDYPVTRRSGRQQGVISFELCLQALASHKSKGNSKSSDSEPKISTRATPNSVVPLATQQSYDREYSSTRSTVGSFPTRINTRNSKDLIKRNSSRSRQPNSDDLSKQEEFSLLESYSHY